MKNHVADLGKMACPRCGSDQNPNEPELEYYCGSTATHQSTKCFDREDLFQRVKALGAYAARLESIGDTMRLWCNDPKSCEAWDKAMEEKP